MNGYLRVAAAHLEQVVDPGAGQEVNERRAAELALALSTGDGLAERLRPDADDAAVLSPLAWVWLLPVLAESHIAAPEPIIDAVFDMTPSPFVKLRLIQMMTARVESAYHNAGASWLSRRIRVIADDADEHPDAAILMGQLLLQTGNESARAAFHALLGSTPTHVKEQLARFVSRDSSGFDSWFGEDDAR